MSQKPMPSTTMKMIRLARVLPWALAFAVAGCAPAGNTPSTQTIADEDPALIAPERPSVADRITIVFLGDSLTAGLGLQSNQAFPSVIGEMFAAEGYWEVEVINGGLSGDTTAGGLRRLDVLLTPTVSIVVVGLGGNDALRGLTVAQTYENLAAILDRSLAFGADVVLAGMEGPTNLGEDYRAAFRDVFVRLASEYRGQIQFVPFLLEGVAGRPEFNQADGIHPNEQGARMIADLLYPRLRNLVDLIPPPLPAP